MILRPPISTQSRSSAASDVYKRQVKECQFDAAIIAVKSFDTERLMKSLIEVIGLLPPFISLQNGVENEALLASYLGKAKVVSASVCTAISRKQDGLIKVEKLRGIGITAGHFLSEDIYKAFRSANLKPALIADGTAMKWSKMISNLLANASSAILDMTPAEIFSDPDGFRLEIRQIRETAVSYTHLRAHETVLDLVCRLLLEKKNYNATGSLITTNNTK